MRSPKGRIIKPPNPPEDGMSNKSGLENETYSLIQEIRSLGTTLREIRDILKTESTVEKRG